MAKRSNPQNVIDSYKRRQRMTPYVIGGLAALLVIAGVVILVLALKPGGLAPAPTATATEIPPTMTSSPTATDAIPDSDPDTPRLRQPRRRPSPQPQPDLLITKYWKMTIAGILRPSSKWI